MPYAKDAVGRKARLNKDRKRTREAYEDQGLQPLDPYDPLSELRCETCGKTSGRNANKKYRHYPTCTKLKDNDEN